MVIVNPESQINYFHNKGNKTMSNEQLMQEELKKAIALGNEVASDELSDEDLEQVAGGINVVVCFLFTRIRRRIKKCLLRSRIYSEND